MPSNARTTVAWLLWCANEGYLNAGDRSLLTNHFEEDDPATLAPEDRADMPHWLGMADEVLAAIDGNSK